MLMFPTRFIDGVASGGRGLALVTLVLLGASNRPAFASPAPTWHYCYAGSDQSRRFYVSQPFSTADSLQTVEREWVVWLGRQPVRYETAGCPRGDDRAAIEASIASAVRYNLGLGRSTVALDWQFSP